MRTRLERGQVFLKFDARLFLNHVRIAKKIPMIKAKTHTVTIPAMAPGFNDDAEAVLVSCDKGIAEDVGGDKVDEDGDMDEDSDMEEVDVWYDRALLAVIVTDVVVSNDSETLARVSGCKVVYEGIDVEKSGRISTTVIVVGGESLASSMLSSLSATQTNMSSSREKCW